MYSVCKRVVSRKAAVQAFAKQQQQQQQQFRFKSAPAMHKDAMEGGSSSRVPIGASLLAALCGVSTVSLVANVVENQTADDVPKFDLNGQRFDQSDFKGRFCKMLLACDPKLLLHTNDQVLQAQQFIHDNLPQNNSSSSTVSRLSSNDKTLDRRLWEAKRVCDAAIHPDTGAIIPRPFRMSGYVPYNGPICVAMVASTSTMPLLFWSWVNQSQNALVNYYNRNASSPMSNATLLTSYSAAVGSALAVAFGLSTLIQKRYSPEKARQLMKFVAFPSAVVASSLNCYIVRSPEIETGIPLLDDNHEPIRLDDNLSQVAAQAGVNSTTLSRAILQAPVYFLPPILMSALPPIQRTIAKYPQRNVPITTFLLLVSFGVGLPVTTAIFPQMSTIDASQVEPKFQHLINPKTDAPYKVYHYNKGL